MSTRFEQEPVALAARRGASMMRLILSGDMSKPPCQRLSPGRCPAARRGGAVREVLSRDGHE
jgi:hypothetical protein